MYIVHVSNPTKVNLLAIAVMKVIDDINQWAENQTHEHEEIAMEEWI
jgi:hypothetical protein